MKARLQERNNKASMSHLAPAYVIFDGDNDKWAYGFMKGWRRNERINFDFQDAHDLDDMTSRAQSESYVKSRLRERMKRSTAVIVLVGNSTKNLYRFVRWELNLALELRLPMIVVNLNGQTWLDADFCPPIIRNQCAVHVSFKSRIIKYALDNWPTEYRSCSMLGRLEGPRYYPATVYESLEI
jgi:hypothetical protein